jgi:hypothetical protein
VEPQEFRIGPFEPSRGNGGGNGSTNGHRNGTSKLIRVAAVVWRVVAGALVAAMAAGALVPRIHFLNLALYNPWVRPVLAAGAGGFVAGLVRRSTPSAGALAGAVAGVFGLWLAYLATRSQFRVLFVERSAAHVILADLTRLAAYAAAPGVLGGASGARLRTRAPRERDNAPITEV